MKRLPQNIARKIAKMFLLGVILVAANCGRADAQILVSYGFPGAGNDTAPQPTTITITDPTTTSALNFDAAAGFNVADSHYVSGFQVSPTSANGYQFPATLTAAVTSNEYYTFTVAPTSGYKLNISGIDLSNTGFYSQNEARTFYVESSATGFGTSPSNILYSITTSGTLGAAVDLSTNSAFQNLTSAVEFRIFPTEGTGGYETVSLQNSLIIDGTAVSAVPEPSTYALVALGVGCILFVAKRRKPILS